MPAGQQIAFEPALAGVLGQDLHDPAVAARDGRHRAGVSAFQARSVASNTCAEPVGGGLVGAEQRGSCGAASLAVHHVAQVDAPSTRGRLGVVRARRCRPRPRSRRNPADRGRASTGRHWRAGWRSCGGRPRARAPRSPAAARRRRRTVPAGGSSASSPRAAATCSGFSAISANGTWCERQNPSVLSPSTSFGPVQPLGVCRMIIGQLGRWVEPAAAGPRSGSRRSRRTPGRASPPSAGASSRGRRPRRNSGL